MSNLTRMLRNRLWVLDLDTTNIWLNGSTCGRVFSCVGSHWSEILRGDRLFTNFCRVEWGPCGSEIRSCSTPCNQCIFHLLNFEGTQNRLPILVRLIWVRVGPIRSCSKLCSFDGKIEEVRHFSHAYYKKTIYKKHLRHGDSNTGKDQMMYYSFKRKLSM